MFVALNSQIETNPARALINRPQGEVGKRLFHIKEIYKRSIACTLALLLVFTLSPAPAKAEMPYQQLIPFANRAMDGFWRQVFASSGRQFYPAHGVFWYGQPTDTPCGTSLPENAFYCYSSHSIYYDNKFLWRLYRQHGDYAAAIVLAHEYGHLVQAQLGIVGPNSRYYTIQTELQADCLAGAFTKHAAERGMLEPGDDEEAITQLFRLGDGAGTPWFDSGAHGSPRLRVYNYMKGRRRGARACFTERQW